MEILIGGSGFSFYKVESANKYAKEISGGIQSAYSRICNIDIPTIIKDMSASQTNEYLLYLFHHYEKTFSIDLAKEQLKNELLKMLGKCISDEEKKAKEKLIKRRMREFGSEDIIDYIVSDVMNKIKMANCKYEDKMKEVIKESLYD